MGLPMITLRYEIMTVDRMSEEEIEAPDEWASMTDDERHQWCLDALASGMCNYIGTSYDWDGVAQ